MIIKSVCIAMFAWGLADILGHWADFDVWSQFAGVRLDPTMRKFSGVCLIVLSSAYWLLGTSAATGR